MFNKNRKRKLPRASVLILGVIFALIGVFVYPSAGTVTAVLCVAIGIFYIFVFLRNKKEQDDEGHSSTGTPSKDMQQK